MNSVLFKTLFDAARAAQQHSYSPISHYKVGAAIHTATGSIYAGTNIEEAAFNHSVHAEQAAIAQMVTKEGRQRITELVVMGGRLAIRMSAAPAAIAGSCCWNSPTTI